MKKMINKKPYMFETKVPIVIKTNSFSTRSGNTSMLEQNILEFFAGGSIRA